MTNAACSGAKIFIAGANRHGETLCASGGRVLAVSAFGANADEAHAKAYNGLAAISFEGMGFRSDIGRE